MYRLPRSPDRFHGTPKQRKKEWVWPYLRGAYARNQQAEGGTGCELDSFRATTMAMHPFKLLVNRSAIAALTANGGTLDMMQHQIDQFQGECHVYPRP